MARPVTARYCVRPPRLARWSRSIAPRMPGWVACGLPMADGLTLCVYINKEEKACADLVNAAGVRVDHVELAELAGQADFSRRGPPAQH